MNKRILTTLLATLCASVNAATLMLVERKPLVVVALAHDGVVDPLAAAEAGAEVAALLLSGGVEDVRYVRAALRRRVAEAARAGAKEERGTGEQIF